MERAGWICQDVVGRKTRQRGGKKGKWKWGDGVEIKAEGKGKVEDLCEGGCRKDLKRKE